MLVNKWDLMEKETNTAKEYEKELKERLAPFTDVPILFISVIDKTRIFKAVEDYHPPVEMCIRDRDRRSGSECRAKAGEGVPWHPGFERVRPVSYPGAGGEGGGERE